MKLTFLFILSFVSNTFSENCPEINKKFDKATDRLYSKLINVVKILSPIKDNESDRPQSCEDVGQYRVILPQPEVQKVSQEVVGTLPGRYRLYEGADDKIGRLVLKINLSLCEIQQIYIFKNKFINN